MVFALLFLVAYGVPIIWPEISPEAHSLAEQASWVIWITFVADFLVRLGLAERRGHFLRKNWLDIPVIALPLLRPLRLLRLVTLLRFLDRRATNSLHGKVLTYVLGGSALLALVGALSVLEAERDNPGANIHTFGDAIWWAVTTMTTVGYGDTYPTTLTGRVIAVFMMIGGIAILGTVTAAVASWLVERVQLATKPEGEILHRLTELQAQVDRLLALHTASLGQTRSESTHLPQEELPSDLMETGRPS